MGNTKVTIVLAVQFTKTAMLVALPRASDLNNSDVISHGIAPGPIENATINRIADAIVRQLNASEAVLSSYSIKNKFINRQS